MLSDLWANRNLLLIQTSACRPSAQRHAVTSHGWWLRMEITYATSSSTDVNVASMSSTSTSTSTSRQVKVIPFQHLSSAPSSSSSSSIPFGAKWRSKLKRMTCTDWMEVLLPCSRWIRTYKWREYLQIDLMAGVTVGIMLVPQVSFSLLIS